MSKTASKKNTSSFQYTAQNNLPKIKAYPTAWDMKKLYYKSIADPQIELDVQTTEKAIKAFVRKYQKADFTSNSKTLLKALQELDRMENTPSLAKPLRYLGLLSALDTNNEAVSKKLNVLSQRLTKSENSLLFFELELAKTSKENQKKFLQDSLLSDYHYHLKNLFQNAKHHLSEAEEKILNLTGDCSYGMWVEMTEKMLGRRSINYKGRTIPLNEAIDAVGNLSFSEKPKLWAKVMAEVKTLDEVVENELTAIVTKKKISDELRGFKKPYSASVLNHEDNEKSVTALVAAVSSKGFALSKKFYSLKAKLHKVNKLDYSQRNASLGQAPNITFAQAVEICRDVFYGVNPEYGSIFDRLLSNGQIDVYPKAGKRGGAFMSSETAQPTNVFLNQLDNFTSLTTFAHEMGHAIHSESSKTQPVHYQSYSTTTAETASTLFEGLLFDAIFAQADPKTRTVLLHDKLTRDISTIQRQIAFHNFELEMHEKVRAEGAITRDELNKMMQKHLKSYMGPKVDISEQDGHSYVYISHFRYGFYVYTYTFGTLMSTLMAEALQADSAYAEKIDTFLTAGSSDTVENIFKRIGLKTAKIETFRHGLDKMQAEIAELTKLTKNK